YTEAGRAFGEIQPDRYHLLVYEQLCATPAETLGGLMAWLGESLDRRQLELDRSRHAYGLEDPKVVETTAVHGDSVGRWPNVLTAAEAERVRERSSDLWSRVAPAAAQ